MYIQGICSRVKNLNMTCSLMTSHKSILLGVGIIIFILLNLSSCYKDEIIFTPDLTSEESVSEWLLNFLHANKHYQIPTENKNEFIPLENGWWIEVPHQSLANQNNEIICSGPLTMKVNLLGIHTSDFLFAPSMEINRHLFQADFCMNLEFSAEGQPLKVIKALNIYIPVEDESILHTLNIYGYDSESAESGWRNILSDQTTIDWGTWAIPTVNHVRGLKVTTSHDEDWLALVRQFQENTPNEKDLIVVTDNHLNNQNCAVFFIPENGHGSVRMDFDANSGRFYKNIFTPSNDVRGHLIILADRGNNTYSFKKEKIQMLNSHSVFHLNTEIQPIEKIKRDLNSL